MGAARMWAGRSGAALALAGSAVRVQRSTAPGLLRSRWLRTGHQADDGVAVTEGQIQLYEVIIKLQGHMHATFTAR